MNLGYTLRQIATDSSRIARETLNLAYYLAWLAFDPTKFKKIKTNKIKTLMIVYSSALGDMITAIGLCNSLNQKYPNLKIYFLTGKKNFKYFRNPNITPIDKETIKPILSQKKIDATILLTGAIMEQDISDKEMYKLLRKVKYRVSCERLPLNLKILIKQINFIGINRKVFAVNSNGFKDQLKSFNFLGFDIKKPVFYYTKEGEKFAKSFITKNKIKEEKLIFLHPGSEKTTRALKENKTPSTLWPTERWASLADRLISKFNAKIILTGVKEEEFLIKEIISKMKNEKSAINLAGKTSIEQAASLLKRGNLIITIDTGMAHLAAQTGIPMIDIFGIVSPKDCAPLCKSTNIFNDKVCSRCRRYSCPEGNNICLKSIPFQKVLSAAEKLIENKKYN